MDRILLSHGGGGKRTQSLIKEVFLRSFRNAQLQRLDDGALFNGYVVTTDSFVVHPLFFPGGDIGKLAVAGTVNDLVAMGGKPLYLTTGFIIEEGFSGEKLKKIVESMEKTAEGAGVEIITGDTKVVEKGRGDGVYINTTGIGKVVKEVSKEMIKPGDLIVINGGIAEHGISILLARNEFQIQGEIKSDCAPLWSLVRDVLGLEIHFMRDATRGGLAAVLNEIVCDDWGIEIWEESIPIKDDVMAVCELLGIDPLTVANEGKMVFIVGEEDGEKLVKKLKSHPLGRDAVVIGRVVEDVKNRVVEKTVTGVRRIVEMPVGESLPRIC